MRSFLWVGAGGGSSCHNKQEMGGKTGGNGSEWRCTLKKRGQVSSESGGLLLFSGGASSCSSSGSPQGAAPPLTLHADVFDPLFCVCLNSVAFKARGSQCTGGSALGFSHLAYHPLTHTGTGLCKLAAQDPLANLAM